jgi:hypothetical protein
MSSQLPPDPILTTYQYWNWLNVDEATRRQRALDSTYMMFPTVQNNPVSFSKLFFATDVALTKMANTSYVYALIQSLLSATTWTGSNQFNSIKVNTLADITLNDADFAGTTTLTNSTFNEPLTPTYDYPVGPELAPNTPSIGTAGTIGFVAPVTFITDTLASGAIAGGGASLRSVTLTQGIWLLSGSFQYPSFNLTSSNIQVAVTLNSGVNALFRKGTQALGTLSNPYPRGMSTIGFINVSPIFPATNITYYLNGRNDSGSVTVTNIRFVAIRIA